MSHSSCVDPERADMSCAHSTGRASSERNASARCGAAASAAVQRSWVAEGNLSDALSDIGRPGSGPPAAGPRAGRQGLERRGAVRRRHSECCRAGRQGLERAVRRRHSECCRAGRQERAVLRRRSESWRAGPGPGTRSLGQSCCLLQCAAGDRLATAAVIVGCSNLI